MPKHLLLSLVDDPLDLCDRHIKLLSKWLIAYAVYQPSLQNGPMLFVQDPFINNSGYLCSGIVSHFFLVLPTIATFTLPLPVLLTLTLFLLAVPFAEDLLRLVAVFDFFTTVVVAIVVYLPIIACFKKISVTFVRSYLCRS